ncbi:type I pantothenate kinase [Ligilactobacillus cholophilus]|uniref:type I pantothenate kinase n=1 Tax=Ligilactobacillus cholophilus TaxID=3050131 RepID=UPI0025B13C70|nr:type I pantothenate kinase [Ligilactobacillus cholophilus]
MEESLNYFRIPRKKWREYYEKNIVPLTEKELEHIKSLNDRISIKDVQEIYMPLVYYIEMQLNVQKYKQEQTARFLGKPLQNIPFIIGIAGSVAVGKSTTARLLKLLLKEAFPGKKVQLITTDGFLYPNAYLKEHQLLNRKGFPESYDMEKLIHFIDEVKSGKLAQAPVYSHQSYDIIPNRVDVVNNPDILIVEGINVLQLPSNQQIYVSDYFDFSIYVDAEEKDIRRWYLERFEMLLNGAFNDPHNYYYSLAQKENREKAFQIAKNTWETVNHVNLHEYILPTKNRADLIMAKGSNHLVNELLLRKY